MIKNQIKIITYLNMVHIFSFLCEHDVFQQTLMMADVVHFLKYINNQHLLEWIFLFKICELFKQRNFSFLFTISACLMIDWNFYHYQILTWGVWRSRRRWSCRRWSRWGWLRWGWLRWRWFRRRWFRRRWFFCWRWSFHRWPCCWWWWWIRRNWGFGWPNSPSFRFIFQFTNFWCSGGVCFNWEFAFALRNLVFGIKRVYCNRNRNEKNQSQWLKGYS